ncbi:MAG: hypothetical protein GYB66_14025 [Chloroflexi bacterium]|nr:hypothetical protein [Chloroflexota bacterium]
MKRPWLRLSSFFLLAALVTFACLAQGNATTTYAQSPGPDLCVRDFEDVNQNGAYDIGEPPFIGLGVFVSLASSDVITGSLTTSPDLDCLRTLSPGEYTVEFTGWEPHQPTTDTRQNITLEDDTVTVDFGVARLRAGDDEDEIPPAGEPRAQEGEPVNRVCMLVFNDLNENGQREEGEELIAGIDINLRVDQSDAIIETVITTDEDFVCFGDLGIGAYRIQLVPGPHYRPTTAIELGPAFVDRGNRVWAEFGAITLDPFTSDAVLPNYVTDEDELTLDQEVRVLLAILGTGMVVLFMIGMGAIVLGVTRR